MKGLVLVSITEIMGLEVFCEVRIDMPFRRRVKSEV